MAKPQLIDLVIFILFLLTVYFILTRIFGHSATDVTISISLFTLLGGLLYKLNRELGEFKIKTIFSFEKLKDNLDKIKENVNGIEIIKESIIDIKDSVKDIKNRLNKLEK